MTILKFNRFPGLKTTRLASTAGRRKAMKITLLTAQHSATEVEVGKMDEGEDDWRTPIASYLR